MNGVIFRYVPNDGRRRLTADQLERLAELVISRAPGMLYRRRLRKSMLRDLKAANR